MTRPESEPRGMFRSVMSLGHIRGIRIELHASWLVIFALLLFTMTTGLRDQFAAWSFSQAVVTALFTSLAFFASIVAHELGHSLVAIRRGVPVRAITLFIFGGVAQLDKDSENAEDEFWIAIAGPAVSFVLALAFGILSGLAVSESWAVGLGWLAVINFMVAVFNLVPGFPLDGGRVLRALVWKFTGDAGKGMRAAVAGGRLVAYGLFAWGLWRILVEGNLLGGFWLMLLAWFLLNMAEGHGQQFSLQKQLRGIRAGALATPDVPRVAPSTTVEEWVHNRVLPEGQRSYMVDDGHRVLGLVSLSDTSATDRERWSELRIADLMTPIEKVVRVAPETEATEVLATMTEHNLNQLPVMEGDRVVGWIDRERLLRTVNLHLELKA
ncbi:site-2 protease family protein [Halovibrio salipaludis]|nr:site-2 protease family protein [Halovibrio salipaludis]